MQNLLLYRIIRARVHMLAGILAGIAVYLALTAVQNPSIHAVAAWDSGCIVFLILTALSFARTRDHEISANAKRHEDGEWTVFFLTVTGAIMSFAAIILFSSTAQNKANQGFYIGFVATTLAISWLMTNVMFAYRYAHEYYSYDAGGPDFDRGVIFPSDDTPDYLDFVYFSFVLGMTFQVSDCNITSKKLRRLATLQGMIGFLFNTIILALSVNIAASVL